MNDFNGRAAGTSASRTSNDNDIGKKRRLAGKQLTKRLKASTAYGVPYQIIRPTEFEELSDRAKRDEAKAFMQQQLMRMPEEMREEIEQDQEELTRRGLWARPFEKLTKAEREFMENKVDIVAKNDPMPTMNPADFKVGKTKRWAKELYTIISRMRSQSNGLIDMAVMPPRPEEMVFGSFAHQAGKEHYKEKVGGVVLFHPGRGEPETVLRKTMNLSLEGLRDAGIGREEFELMVLEHELSHLAGAGEPQADSMAAIQVMKATESDQMPRYWSDFRMLSTMRSALTKRIADNLAKGIAEVSKKYEDELKELVDKVKDDDDDMSPHKMREKQMDLRKRMMELREDNEKLNSKAVRGEISKQEYMDEIKKLEKREDALNKEGLQLQRSARQMAFGGQQRAGLSREEQQRMMMLQQQVAMMDQHSAFILQHAAQMQQAMTMYGMACVDALDAQVAKGVSGAKAMSEEEVHDMRFTKYNHDPMAVSYLVEVMAEHKGLEKGEFSADHFAAQQNIMGIHALARKQDMKSLGDFSKTLTDESDKRLSDVPAEYRKEVVRIAKRFADASDRMIVPGMTPDQEKEMKNGAKKDSDAKPGRRGPGPVFVRRRMPF